MSVLSVVSLSTSLAMAQPAPEPAPSSPAPAPSSLAPVPAPSSPAPLDQAAPKLAVEHELADERTIEAPDQIPGFVTLHRMDGNSAVGVEASYLEPNTGMSTSAKPRPMHYAIRARYVDRSRGLGGYMIAPYSSLRTGGGDNAHTSSAFGDLELGALYIPRLDSPAFGLVVRAGLTLPTGEDMVGFVTSPFATSDLYNGLASGWTAKLGVAPTLRGKNVFLQLDLGVDWNISAHNATVGTGLHYNAGVGLELGSAALTFEFQNMSLLKIDGTGGTARGADLRAFALGLRVTTPRVAPYVAVGIPLSDDVSRLFDAAVTVGLDARLR